LFVQQMCKKILNDALKINELFDVGRNEHASASANKKRGRKCFL